jgi:hypothetical protein
MLVTVCICLFIRGDGQIRAVSTLHVWLPVDGRLPISALVMPHDGDCRDFHGGARILFEVNVRL